MRRSPKCCRLLLVALALGAAGFGGCAGLPRIDPSGEQFFIFPGETPPVAPGQPVIAAPTAVDPFTGVQPIVPPPGNLPAPPVYGQQSPGLLGGLLPGSVLGPQPPSPTQPQDRLTLTPERVLAPVGSEVVLRAGVCSASGYLITNRRIDWMLDGQGVGQFVEIAEEGEQDVLRWPWQRPKKIDNRYAVGYTSPYHTCLRRSLADPGDDLQIRPGDAWVSVSSATEGTSYITAYNPGVDDWAARKASAVIYWVDAQWQLPPPATVAAGQPHVLTTTITRQTDGAPIAGWIVRYEVVDGSGAQLGYQAGQTSEATTDSQGRASVEIKPTDANPGVSTVNVTIVRPAQAGAGPQINIGSGQTSVSWATGVPATGLPPIVGEPTPAPALPPDTPLDLSPPPAIPRPLGRPELTVRMRRDTADPVTVGDTVAYTILVQNTGDGPARNLVITDRFDQGLSNQYAAADNRVEYTQMSDLGPGESDEVRLEFQVLQPGQRRHEVIVQAENATEAYDRDSFTALPITPPKPNLDVALVADRQRVVGEIAKEIRGVVVNRGATAATNVTVRLRYDSALSPVKRREQLPGEGFVELPGGYQWTLPRIEPGQTQEFAIECRCDQPSRRACLQLDVLADGGLNESREQCLEILPPAVVPGGGGGVVPPVAASPLRASISSTANPGRVGGPGVLNVNIVNTGATPQRQVVVEVFVPPTSVQPSNTNIQAPMQWRLRPDGVVEFAPVADLPSQQQVSILIPYRANAQGDVQMQVRVRSTESPEWTTISEPLRINPQ